MKHPALFVLLAFIFGILFPLNQYLSKDILALFFVFLFLLTVLGLIFNNFFLKSTSIFFLFILCGSLRLEVQNYLPNHHFLKKNSSKGYFLRIKNQFPNSIKGKQRFIAEVLKNKEQQNLTGNVLVYFPLEIKDSVFENKIVYSESNIWEISPPRNPYEFNYKLFLERKEIDGQIFLNENNFTFLTDNYKVEKLENSISNLRTSLTKTLNQKIKNEKVRSVISAILIGDKTFLDRTLKTEFIESGAMHFLAVSGLHIGILLVMLRFLMTPLLLLKGGRYIRLFFLISFLVIFALLVGTPSVSRAVLMFSLFAVGYETRRMVALPNVLFASALIILIYNPNLLFDISFQMSYSAVLGLVYFLPVVRNYFNPKNQIIRFFWWILVVSVVAQLSVLPVSLFRFHQLSSMFLLANYIVYPLVAFILIFGFPFLVIGLFYKSGWLIDFLAKILEVLGKWLIDSVDYLSSFSFSVWRYIYFDEYFLIASLFFLFFLYHLIESKRKFVFMNLIFFMILIIQFRMIYLTTNKSHQDGFYVFNDYKNSVFALSENGKFNWFSENLSDYLSHPIKSNAFDSEHSVFNPKENVLEENYFKTENFVFYKGELFLIIDGNKPFTKELLTLPSKGIILINNPKVTLSNKIKAKIIVADASNKNWRIEKWQKESMESKIRFHATSNEGYFVFR